ncbi:hypothetical protein CDD81_567 [Ophiocordyceps australis]|uniref:Cytochrome b561 domain-containing protein n=1 Tax=Ophiocordyceps australis TaxID=1399860 RepID=A0A2C5YFH3_9HYPO|nr:hypothetical protein CDD81_567 [Ophiocordyceps australis]
MAPALDQLSPPGAAHYDSDTMTVGDGTWDSSKNTFLLPNLEGLNFETMRYNGMGNRFATLGQYHRIILAHGIMAALIFLLLVPISVMTARFYSRQPGYAIVYHAQLHVFSALMLLAVFILGYFAVGPHRSLSNPHHDIGVAIFVLFILQLIGGRLIRHITKRRSLRIMIHQWCGRAIALLGIVQVPLGLTLYGSPRYLFVLYTLWMIFLLLVYFALTYRSQSRREMYMSGARPDPGHLRVTESELVSRHPKERAEGWTKWMGPLAIGTGIWAAIRGRHGRRRGERSPSPSSIYERNRGPDMPPKHESGSFFSDKYSEVPPPRSSGARGAGILGALGGAAAALGLGRLFSGIGGRRRDEHDDEYSAVATDTPRRQRSGRAAPTLSELGSDMTQSQVRYAGDGTNTSLLPPSANPPRFGPARGAGDGPRPATPGPMHTREGYGRDADESDFSSYVSPSRRPIEDPPSGGLAKGIMSGLGLGWIARRVAERRARKLEEQKLREEEEMRNGTQISRFTGDGYPSPTRRHSRGPGMARRSAGRGRDGDYSDVSQTTMDQGPSSGRVNMPMPPHPATESPIAPVPVPNRPTSSQFQSRHDIENVSMPPMPPDPQGILRSAAGRSYISSTDGRRPPQADAARRRRALERSEAVSAARSGSSVRGDERAQRERHESPQSQPVSVKLKVHDDRERNVTLRRLTEQEARAARSHDDESSLSGMDSPTNNGRRYRRESSGQRRAEMEAERRAEAEEQDQLAPLSPPNPSYARGSGAGRRGGYAGTPGTAPAGAGLTVPSTVGSPESLGTVSMSGADQGATDSAANDRRRRRRQERRAAASSTARPAGQDMYE